MFQKSNYRPVSKYMLRQQSASQQQLYVCMSATAAKPARPAFHLSFFNLICKRNSIEDRILIAVTKHSLTGFVSISVLFSLFLLSSGMTIRTAHFTNCFLTSCTPVLFKRLVKHRSLRKCGELKTSRPIQSHFNIN